MGRLFCYGKRAYCERVIGTAEECENVSCTDCEFADGTGAKFIDKTTNYDNIRNMSIDEMAKLFYGIIHERDLLIMKKLEEKGIEASLLEALPEVHIAYHKQWLESEVE